MYTQVIYTLVFSVWWPLYFLRLTSLKKATGVVNKIWISHLKTLQVPELFFCCPCYQQNLIRSYCWLPVQNICLANQGRNWGDEQHILHFDQGHVLYYPSCYKSPLKNIQLRPCPRKMCNKEKYTYPITIALNMIYMMIRYTVQWAKGSTGCSLKIGFFP